MADTTEFEIFYATTYRRVVAQVYLMTGDAHDAEECSQEAFSRAMVRWERISGYEAPYAWVRRVAFNLACSRMRQARRAMTALVRMGPPPSHPPADVNTVLVVEAVRTLPVKYRQVLVLHHLLDLPVREVAEELGVPEATVKTRLARGRRRLSDILEDRDACWEEVGHGRQEAARA
ncbi:sigma-70 family RNA polymerase sigma factor [Streptomyces sp. F63]|uniref:sigma-70 family RNA polymerase sigma factor n=1 Tax=Streptomyces sp. F63 TaxID=2824887 RepID=UPI001B393F9D|nr:sigma-70 family RNA polymerase sigma factor [Streptomyces sp. F63]MBQ0988031.1 sigma-70 family RNA polymerase sigma factor [Streptomyces sp. F63]